MSVPSPEDALPPHEILEEVSRGPLGVVYRARDPSRNAVVWLRAASLPNIPAGRFLHEARAAARLRLPHVLPIYNAGMWEDRPCFTTMPAPEARLSEQPGWFADPRAAADLVAKLADGVAAAHAHGLVHGRLHSGAVFLDAEGRPLIDFFDLPFFLHAANGVSPVADVWSLGVLLYELLAGPLRSESPIPPRRLRRDIDRDLEAVVLRCLQKKPDDRYGSARALADDLERWLRAEPTEARQQPWWRRLLRAL